MHRRHIANATVILMALAGCTNSDRVAQTSWDQGGTSGSTDAASIHSDVPLPGPDGRVDPASIPAHAYVQVDLAGHLMLNGERQRYWGVIGGFPHPSGIVPDDTPEQRTEKIHRAYTEVEVLIQRFIDLGFNLNRTWQDLDDEPYVKGDGSRADVIDYFILRMRERGLRLWAAGINNFHDVTAGDVGIVNDSATAAAWAKAVSEAGGKISPKSILATWDPRLEALAIQQRSAHATHFNQHSGLRWCDDPAFVAWELSNEEWWISKMVGGQWQGLPAFFKHELIDQWNIFLQEKYSKVPKSLLARWGTLLPGESLEHGSIQLLPINTDQPEGDFGMDAQGQKQLADARAGAEPQTYGRKDFARERGEDVLEFFVKLHVSHKQREASALKALGRSVALSPLCYDTGIGYEIQAQYLHQNADAVAHDAYVNGMGIPGPNRDIWTSWVEMAPGICQDVPWLEHNKIQGKPFFAYETQIQQPAKYRVDFPIRLGALASIQDWDIACWHYFAPPALTTSDRPFDQPTDNTIGGHPQGYHYTYDEVQTAMMRAAGMIWRQQLIQPALHPTIYTYGRKSLYDPASMDYGKSYGAIGKTMLPTTYQHGVRIKIDPSRDDDAVEGPTISPEDMNSHNPYAPTREISFDHQKGNIIFDAPGAVAFTGFLPRVGGTYVFANGIAISDIAIDNPPGIYDPIPTSEGYIGFALYSEDGKSLAESKHAALSLMCTSFNTGFSFSKEDFEKHQNSPLAATATEKRQNGRLPVLVARVAGTVTGKAIDGMRYDMLDWHLKSLGEGIVENGRLRVPNDKAVFVIKLSR